MREKRARRVRLVGLALFAALLVLFVSTLFPGRWRYERPGLTVFGYPGAVAVATYDPRMTDFTVFFDRPAPQWPRFWRPQWGKKGAPVYVVLVPLWIPIVLVAGLTYWAHRRARGFPPGHCRRCGYDLTGNISGTCPECGFHSGRLGA
jgi:hypothetical protein